VQKSWPAARTAGDLTLVSWWNASRVKSLPCRFSFDSPSICREGDAGAAFDNLSELRRRFVTRTVPVLALMLGLGACATVPTAGPQADQEGKRFDPPAQGSGVVYVYRPGWMALARTVDVGIAGGYHAKLASNTYFRLEGPPGPIDIVCKTDNTADRQINIAQGETRYVEVAMSAGLLGPRCSVNEVSPQEGQAGVLRSKRVVPQ
jgi:hypothetical protein